MAIKNLVSVKVWLVATEKEKIALNKFLNFMEASNMGVIFRVRDYLCLIKKNIYIYIYINGHFFCIIELHCSLFFFLMKLQVRWF